MCTAYLPTIGGSVATIRCQYWWTYNLLLTYTYILPPQIYTLPLIYTLLSLWTYTLLLDLYDTLSLDLYTLDRITDRIADRRLQNITFPQLLSRTVNIGYF